MTWRQHDSIMVVVEKLTKVAHFIPVKSTYETGDTDIVVDKLRKEFS